MTCGIYRLLSAAGETLYVGQSRDIEGRFYHHSRLLRRGEHHCHGLQAWFSSGGVLPALEILETTADPKLLPELETRWFARHPPRFWGKAPGGSWRWDELSDQTLERVNAAKAERARARFEAVRAAYGERVIELYKRGLSTVAIAEALPPSYGDVRRIVAAHGFRSKREAMGFAYSRGKTSEALAAELKELRRLKKSWEAIAALWGCSSSAVREFAHVSGVEPREVKPSLAAFIAMGDEELKTLMLSYREHGKLMTGRLHRDLGVGRGTLYRRLEKLFPEGWAAFVRDSP